MLSVFCVSSSSLSLVGRSWTLFGWGTSPLFPALWDSWPGELIVLWCCCLTSLWIPLKFKCPIQLLFFMPVLSFCPTFLGDCHFLVASFLPAKFCFLNHVLVTIKIFFNIFETFGCQCFKTFFVTVGFGFIISISRFIWSVANVILACHC